MRNLAGNGRLPRLKEVFDYPQGGFYSRLLYWHLQVNHTRSNGINEEWTIEQFTLLLYKLEKRDRNAERVFKNWIVRTKNNAPFFPDVAEKIQRILFFNNENKAWNSHLTQYADDLWHARKECYGSRISNEGYKREGELEYFPNTDFISDLNGHNYGDFHHVDAPVFNLKLKPQNDEADSLTGNENLLLNSEYKLGYATFGPPLKNIPGLFEASIRRPPQGEFPENISLFLTLDANALIVTADNTQWQLGLIAYTVHRRFVGAQLLPDTTPDHPHLSQKAGLWEVRCQPNSSNDNSLGYLQGELLRETPIGLLTHDNLSEAISINISVVTNEFDLDVRPYIRNGERTNSVRKMSASSKQTRAAIIQRFTQKYLRKDGNIYLGGGSMTIPVDRKGEHD